MRIAGVDVADGAVAELARRLQAAGHLDFAMGVGLAHDAQSTNLTLSASDENHMLSVLEDCPEELAALRHILRRRREHAAAVARRRREQAEAIALADRISGKARD